MTTQWNTDSRRHSCTTWPGLSSGREGHKTKMARPSSSASSETTLLVPFWNPQSRGKNVDGRQLRVKKIEHIEETGACHLLFISQSEKQRLPEILRRVPDRAILTVGDSEGSAKRGTIISFLIEDGAVHFEVNMQAAERGRHQDQLPPASRREDCREASLGNSDAVVSRHIDQA